MFAIRKHMLKTICQWSHTLWLENNGFRKRRPLRSLNSSSFWKHAVVVFLVSHMVLLLLYSDVPCYFQRSAHTSVAMQKNPGISVPPFFLGKRDSLSWSTWLGFQGSRCRGLVPWPHSSNGLISAQLESFSSLSHAGGLKHVMAEPHLV